jgi:ankyrin repeat protein
VTEGVDVNKVGNDGYTALYLSARKDHVEAIKALVTEGADVNKVGNDGYTALHCSARKGNAEAIKALVAEGADVNKVGNDGYTALHCSASGGHVEAIKVLVAAGADVNHGNNNGYTALYLSALEDNAEAIKALVAVGADVNKVYNDGYTALHLASLKGNAEAIKALVAAGADVNKVGNDGYTALHAAASGGHTEAIKALVYAGADVNKVSNKGHTALHFAALEGHAEAIKALATVGAITTSILMKGGTTVDQFLKDEGVTPKSVNEYHRSLIENSPEKVFIILRNVYNTDALNFLSTYDFFVGADKSLVNHDVFGEILSYLVGHHSIMDVKDNEEKLVFKGSAFLARVNIDIPHSVMQDGSLYVSNKKPAAEWLRVEDKATQEAVVKFAFSANNDEKTHTGFYTEYKISDAVVKIKGLEVAIDSTKLIHAIHCGKGDTKDIALFSANVAQFLFIATKTTVADKAALYVSFTSIPIVYEIYEGEYATAATTLCTTVVFAGIPYALASCTGMPYVGLSYTAVVALYSMYQIAVKGAGLYQQITDEEYCSNSDDTSIKDNGELNQTMEEFDIHEL